MLQHHAQSSDRLLLKEKTILQPSSQIYLEPSRQRSSATIIFKMDLKSNTPNTQESTTIFKLVYQPYANTNSY